MGTCGVLGQAAGTAACIAVKNGLTPREAGREKIAEIQAALMEDDCFLPGFRREISPLSKKAKLAADYGDCSVLHNGIERRIWGTDNGYYGKTNKAITYTFGKPTKISQVRLVFDSDLNREYTAGNPDGLNTSTVLFFPLSHDRTTFGFPPTLVKSYRIEAQTGGEWKTVFETKDNHQRLVRHDLCPARPRPHCRRRALHPALDPQERGKGERLRQLDSPPLRLRGEIRRRKEPNFSNRAYGGTW